MKQKIAEYSAKSLYGLFKPEEICFGVAENLKNIEFADVTDVLQEAKEFASSGGQIFIFKKKLVRDCFNFERLYVDLLDDIDQQGYDSDHLQEIISDEEKKEFKEFAEKWFSKCVQNTWFGDELLGVLKNE